MDRVNAFNAYFRIDASYMQFTDKHALHHNMTTLCPNKDNQRKHYQQQWSINAILTYTVKQLTCSVKSAIKQNRYRYVLNCALCVDCCTHTMQVSSHEKWKVLIRFITNTDSACNNDIPDLEHWFNHHLVKTPNIVPILVHCLGKITGWLTI